jgi:GGDEF domain-containing protein
MEDDRESSAFLGRAYKIAKLIAVATASVAGFVISLVALDVTKGHWWVDVKIPLYAAVFIVVFVVIACALASIVALLVARDARSALSYYRNKSKGLEATVSTLRDLAYNDPITGIPNSNKLKQDINAGERKTPHCLVLFDLQNFGEINKKYNHWVGDEYLRKFSQMVSNAGRRNEYLFKSRPFKESEKPTDEGDRKDEVKAFRKNAGGDEFYILLEGTIVDGLGYLNRLAKRANEFERMSLKVLGEPHPFGFSAGVVSVAYGESFESVNKRVSECLGVALEKGSRRRVYWIESEMPEQITSFQKKILEETDTLFARTRTSEQKSAESLAKGSEVYAKT